jgi:catechol 2,3-dioxygenase-like lactoylglutathione lyase family enzyme
MKNKVKGFEHVCLACSNIEKSVEFYRDFLGMTVRQYETTPEGVTVVLLDTSGGGLELFGSAEIRDTPAPQLPPSSAGIRHLALIVSDMAAIYESLCAKGVEFTVLPRKPKVMKNATGVAFCKDPDGNFVEFIERRD